MRSRLIFTIFNLSKHVPIAKTRSHRFWWEWNLSKHAPVAKYFFVSLLTAWISNFIVRCHVLVYLGGPQVLKRSEIFTRNWIFCNEEKVFVETTFPSLLAWLQFVKTCFRRFCHFLATGTCFDKLKLQEILENCPWKHVLIAKTAQKRPQIV